MPNNFRLGTPGVSFYISKEGTVGANSTNPDVPRTQPTNSPGTYIIGAGCYEQVFVFAVSGAGSSTIQGDGRVVYNLTGAQTMSRSDGNGGTLFNNIWLNLNTFAMTYTIGINNHGFTDCVVQNGTITYSGGTANASLVNTRTVFNNITYTCLGALSGDRSWNYCQIYNSTFVLVTGATIPMRNTYVDESTTITWQTFAAQAVAGGFLNNNFMGKVVVSAVAYELKKDKAGVDIPGRILNGVLDIVALYPNVYTTGKNFAQDAEFGNLEKFDFMSVAPTSPNLYADTTGLLHIGNVLVATPLKATDANFSGGTITNLTVSGNDFTVTAGTSGTAVSLPVQVAPIPQVVGRVSFGKLDAFNSDTVSFPRGTAKNNNVTAKFNYAAGTAGANPRRLTYEMRWSTKSTMPTVDADWDNNGYVTAGDYLIFECSTQPKVDVSGYGNGSPEFVTVGSANIQAKWVQYRMTVRDGFGV